MRARVRNALIGALGAVAGASAVTALWAQATPPVYIIVDIGEITDAAAMSAAVGQGSSPTAQILVRTQKATRLDGGAAPARFVVAQFETEAKAREWFNSPGIAAINAVRLEATKSRAFLVEGMPK